MTDETTGAGAQETNQASDAPHVQVHAQYVKDLSFENPEAPQSLSNQSGQPSIEVSVDVGARGLTASQFEVELRITAQASHGESKAFVVEVLYAGVFTLFNVDESSLRQVCLIECPRLLFPFARRIVADATRDGGFPPLLLEPIDFAGLYRDSADKIDEDEGGNGNDGGSDEG